MSWLVCWLDLHFYMQTYISDPRFRVWLSFKISFHRWSPVFCKITV
jgi:hypothetical protein